MPSDQSNTGTPFESKLIGYPDGQDWHCSECGGIVVEQNFCAKHPTAELQRVNQRYVWGPGPEDFNDVVVEFRDATS